MKPTTSKSSIITQIVFAAVAILLGYLLLFNEATQVDTLCKVMCGGLVVVGVVSIASYFLAGDYKRIDRYGFALGTLLILAGCIGMLRIENLTANFEMYAGALSLLLGVLVLQGTVQVKVLDYAVWVLNLVLALACLIGSFCVLAGITAVTGLVNGFSSWLLLVCGGSCIFSLFVTWICIMLAGRREKKAQKEKEAQAQALAEAQAQNAAKEEVLPGTYQPTAAPSYDAQPAPSQPAEIHHTGFDPAADAATAAPESDLPPAESPELVFEPSETHHSDFTPTE